MIIAAAIDLIGGRCVRLYQGDFRQQTTYSDDPVAQAHRFQDAGFSRLHVIDLEGARAGDGRNRETVRRLADAIDLPLQTGGGIRSERDVAELFSMGVDYLILGTTVLKEPGKVGRWLERWGTQGFVVSLDLKKGRLRTEGWLEESRTELGAVVDQLAEWGIEQVICTDVESDGTLKQPNYETYEDLRKRLPGTVTLMAAGGVSRPEHVFRLAQLGVDGVVVGRALYEGDLVWEELVRAG